MIESILFYFKVKCECECDASDGYTGKYAPSEGGNRDFSIVDLPGKEDLCILISKNTHTRTQKRINQINMNVDDDCGVNVMVYPGGKFFPI